MRLPILDNRAAEDPWFSEGLRFTCTQCGNCCTGGPGFVWISEEEIERVAKLLGISRQTVRRKYCRRIGGRTSLKEIRHERTGGYDCIFMKEIETGEGGASESPHRRRICTIYSSRPLQCRTWPFWEGNLASHQAWRQAARTCPGIDRGKHYSRSRIEALRDAREWPENPPTSK